MGATNVLSCDETCTVVACDSRLRIDRFGGPLDPACTEITMSQFAPMAPALTAGQLTVEAGQSPGAPLRGALPPPRSPDWRKRGDTNGDGNAAVTTNEIIKGVTIALGTSAR